MKITAHDIRGVVGIVPTPATPDADRWDATATVSLPESQKMVDVRFRAAGLIDPGPTRLPYVGAPAEYIAGAQEVGRRWAQLEHEFAREVAGSR